MTARLAVVFLLALVPLAVAADPPKPNVLLVLADDLGFSDLGCYGSEIDTPTLNGLAKGGLRFTNFYNTGRCWPTRGSILTGYYAQQIRRDTVPGVTERESGGNRPAWARLLPELLEATRLPLVPLRQVARRRSAAAERVRTLVQPERPRPPLRPKEAHRGRQAAAAREDPKSGYYSSAPRSPTTPSPN